MKNNLTRYQVVETIINEGIKTKYKDFEIKDIDFDLIEELVNAKFSGMIDKEKLDEIAEQYFALTDRIDKNS